jgi:phasin family protein
MEASPQVAKTPYEYFTIGNQAFKDSIERTIAALTELNTHSKKNLEALIASATAAAKGVETVGTRAVAFSKKSVENQIAAAKALAAAKSIQEAVELQTGYAKSAFETYVAEVNEISEITSASVKDALTPINERVTAIVERAQAPR